MDPLKPSPYKPTPRPLRPPAPAQPHDTVTLSAAHIAAAWRDEDAHDALSATQKAQVPASPAGNVHLQESGVKTIMSGTWVPCTFIDDGCGVSSTFIPCTDTVCHGPDS